MHQFSKVLPVGIMALAGFMPVAALAQDEACVTQQRALWEDGAPLDEYQRPPHRNTLTMYDASGGVTREFLSVVETPLRTISGVENTHMTLAIDKDVWTGPGMDGPWTKQPQGFTHDRRATHDMERAQRQANLTDMSCPGMVERDGGTYLAYGFTTKTDPNEEMGGMWFGAANTVYIEPETNQVMIWEMADLVSSWAPEPNGERHVIVYEYDPSVTVPAPE